MADYTNGVDESYVGEYEFEELYKDVWLGYLKERVVMNGQVDEPLEHPKPVVPAPGVQPHAGLPSPPQSSTPVPQPRITSPPPQPTSPPPTNTGSQRTRRPLPPTPGPPGGLVAPPPPVRQNVPADLPDYRPRSRPPLNNSPPEPPNVTNVTVQVPDVLPSHFNESYGVPHQHSAYPPTSYGYSHETDPASSYTERAASPALTTAPPYMYDEEPTSYNPRYLAPLPPSHSNGRHGAYDRSDEPFRSASYQPIPHGEFSILDRTNSQGSNYFSAISAHDSDDGANMTTIDRGAIPTQTIYTSNGPNREDSMGSVGSPGSDHYFTFGNSTNNIAGPSGLTRSPSDVLNHIRNYGPRPLELHQQEDFPDDESCIEGYFVNLSLLSHLAVQLHDKVPRGTHVKGSIPYPRAFTGKDIVSTIASLIRDELRINHGVSTAERSIALQVARSLQSQLFFYEVEWGGQVLQDGVEDVYMFPDDSDVPSDMPLEKEELPTGVIVSLSKCYASGCMEGVACYAYGCPRKGDTLVQQASALVEPAPKRVREEWRVPPEVLSSLPESEISRQTIIHKLIIKEEQYIRDLDLIETTFIQPLRTANPPVMPPLQLEEFMDEVFGNFLELRDANKRLLEFMYVRQREQGPVIQRIGDIFLDAATELFRSEYPLYIGNHPVAERRLKEEMDNNPEFRLFIEKCSRKQVSRFGENVRLDLRQCLSRPSEHLQKYPILIDVILKETADGNPDADFLAEAINALKNLQNVAQLRTFQSTMGRGITSKWEWHDLVSPDVIHKISPIQMKRQSIMWELIKGEMSYVKDLESIEKIYIRPLRDSNPPIIGPDRLPQFLQDVFHNYAELHAHHRRLVDSFHEIQREEHPEIRSLVAPVFDAALNFREAYLEYIPNYPIAAFRIDEELEKNPAFRAFHEQTIRHPDAHRLDMKSFINRPIPRLLRYELLLKNISDHTPPDHPDREVIPEVIDIIKSLGKETEPGVESAKQKVRLWKFNSDLVSKAEEGIDLDLLNENRSLLHTGKLYRQAEGWESWSELFVLLFDNYLVLTKKVTDKNGITKYNIVRRPIPLDLLTLVNFADQPAQRATGLLRGLRREDAQAIARNTEAGDSRLVYPCTIHHNGRTGGNIVLYAETNQAREEWKQKLEEAIGLRKVVQEANKVFEMETLSNHTFTLPPPSLANTPWNDGSVFTGKVTCSVPFMTADSRSLVAIGCTEGVWIGFRHDSHSMRRVLHLRGVTQCAMLEDFGLFLILSEKTLYAYHIEALVPTVPGQPPGQGPQKLGKDVSFFRIGSLQGRTVVIYMRKRGTESHFHVMEPVVDRINEVNRPTSGFGIRLGLSGRKPDWFRTYREFFLTGEVYDVVFLKAKLAILNQKGFEIMDLSTFNSVIIPQKDDAQFAHLTKRSDSCKPLGMYRCTEDEFLLCYDEFGLYVNRHGDPSRHHGVVEWEGTAERVALHAPYILLFDPRFIEVRHLETGRLAQLITGSDIRCTWDSQELDLQNAGGGPVSVSEDQMSQSARIHGVMNVSVNNSQPALVPVRVTLQHVFELVPTIPLYLPGSLASPSTVAYFPQSYSPPRSPPTRNSRQLG
ncbi:hypothetical protein AX16_008106 [Volvariella volvacea WC 439]|nr:hypothetical protein AX16_008106 [Volvariella volvacea WC 439]